MAVKKKSSARLICLCGILIATIILFSFQQISIQITNRAKVLESANGLTESEMIVKAARGEIIDCYGRPIAINKDGYDVVLNGAYLPDGKYNETILSLLKIFEQAGETWRDDLPISMTEPYEFTDDTLKDKVIRLYPSLSHYASAENCVSAMIETYKLQQYDKVTQRRLMGVRYSMQAVDFSKTRPFTIASDIEIDTMTIINEFSMKLQGVEIRVVPIREYIDTNIAPHIIGDVGPITADSWDGYKALEYSYDDIVGRMGVEKAFEEFLKGKDGINIVSQDPKGKVTSVDEKNAPRAGHTTVLTIDKYLQQVAQDALKQRIQNDPNSVSGAVSVIDVRTGGVLAAASYPSFDMKDYRTDYSTLSSDESAPLFDRAFSGKYPPGSVFKPMVAAASLQTGKISVSDTVFCGGSKKYYDAVKGCTGSHGYCNVVRAITKSCNIFFYDMGMKCGIECINDYARKFGLGIKTGVEIEESAGVLTDPKKVGFEPVVGIGQADTALTPLQLSVYTATVANNGTRLKAHLLKEVKSYDLQSTIQAEQVTVAAETGVSQYNMDLIKQGMRGVITEGTARYVFSDFKISVGGKTGTAQVTGKRDNAVFIAFAPFDKPQIAIAVVVESGGFGSTVSEITKIIMDAYFNPPIEEYVSPAAGSMIP